MPGIHYGHSRSAISTCLKSFTTPFYGFVFHYLHIRPVDLFLLNISMQGLKVFPLSQFFGIKVYRTSEASLNWHERFRQRH